jgi:hypothetical protein
MVEKCCCTSQLYRPIQTRNESKNRTAQDTDLQLYSVGVAGFEPTASSSRTKRATKLRHTPDGRCGV